MKELRFNVVKDERKALVKAISEITGVAPKYLGAPGFEFAVGDYIINATGTVTFTDEQNANALGDLLSQLAERGFVYETEGNFSRTESCFDEPEVESICSASAEISESIAEHEADIIHDINTDAVAEPSADKGLLSIDMPLFGIGSTAIANLERLITSKAWILKKMTGAEILPVEKLENRLRFPWFKSNSTAKEIDAYSRLIVRLCETSKLKKRVMADERLPQPGDNEKYKARCFLLALDFKGAEYSQARKILLAPFPGNGSFLQGESKKVAVPTSSADSGTDMKIITKAMLENTSSFTDAAKPGDYVEEAIVDDFLGCVPPATHRANLIQCGEPYSSDWNEAKKQYEATYFTFSFDGSMWKYCGTCFLGETEHRGSAVGHVA